MASPDALKALFEALQAEQRKRARARGQDLIGDRESFHRQLDLMAERLRAAPGFIEPTPAQKALMLQDLDRYLAAHYGSQPRKTRSPA